ncbi:MAG TPA: peptidylprolyl isomerase [Polyangiaceae bacterium]|jgi:peptidyl-prolyl cis-trans isomerase D|nr:peptidylprolyl isomerase [Polyangiaceae bacterium]
MLSIFRGGGVAQVVVGGIAFSIILVFALEFRAGRNGPTASLKKECAIEIKGACIDPKEYYASFGLVAPRGLDPRGARQLGLHKKVVDGLVERELLVAEAERLGVSASEADVEAELLNGRAHVSLPAQDAEKLSYQLGLCRRSEEAQGCESGADTMVRELHVKRTADEPFDYAVYEREVRILANRGPKEFKEMQQRELLAARMRDLIREPVRVPETEAFAIFSQQRSTATIRSVALARDWFAKYVIDLSDAAVSKWAADNKAAIDAAWETDKASFTAGCIPTREILLEIGPGANDDDRAQARKKLDSARQRVSGGESFASVARSVSEGQTANLGGELGCVGASYGVGNEEVAKAAAALKPGELSQIVETPRGLHLLEVEAKLDAGNLEASGKRYVARKLYVRATADAQVKSFAEELIKRVKAGAKLEDALDAQLAVVMPAPAKKPGEDKAPSVPALAANDRPKVDISSPFNVSGNPLPQLTPKEPLAAHAFELKSPDDLWQTPIETTDGSVVVQLKEKSAASRDEFDKNKAAILGPMTRNKANEALSYYVSELKKKLGDKLKIDPRYNEEPKSSRNDDE